MGQLTGQGTRALYRGVKAPLTETPGLHDGERGKWYYFKPLGVWQLVTGHGRGI